MDLHMTESYHLVCEFCVYQCASGWRDFRSHAAPTKRVTAVTTRCQPLPLADCLHRFTGPSAKPVLFRPHRQQFTFLVIKVRSPPPGIQACCSILSLR